MIYRSTSQTVTVLTRVNPSPNAAAQDGHPQKARVLETLPQAPPVTTLKFLGLSGITDKKNTSVKLPKLEIGI